MTSHSVGVPLYTQPEILAYMLIILRSYGQNILVLTIVFNLIYFGGVVLLSSHSVGVPLYTEPEILHIYIYIYILAGYIYVYIYILESELSVTFPAVSFAAAFCKLYTEQNVLLVEQKSR